MRRFTLAALAAVLILLCVPCLGALPTVVLTLDVANPDGTFPTSAPFATMQVTWTQAPDPAVHSLAVAPAYDALTGKLTWTVPQNSQVKLNCPSFGISAWTYSVGTSNVTVNGLTPITPAATPGWFPAPTAADIGNRLYVAADLSLGWTAATTLTATPPLAIAAGAVSIPQATAAADGYLSGTDFATFAGKEPAIAAGTVSQYWRGDKTWQTLPAATPGGTSGQLQYNAAGAFGGIAGSIANATTGGVTIAAQGAVTTPITASVPAASTAPNLVLNVPSSTATSLISLAGVTGNYVLPPLIHLNFYTASPANPNSTLAFATNVLNFGRSGVDNYGDLWAGNFGLTGNQANFWISTDFCGSWNGAVAPGGGIPPNGSWGYGVIDASSASYAGQFYGYDFIFRPNSRYATLPRISEGNNLVFGDNLLRWTDARDPGAAGAVVVASLCRATGSWLEIGDGADNANGSLLLKDLAASGITTTAAPRITPKAVTAATYTVLSTDGVILADATAGAITITLTAATGSGHLLRIKKTDASVNTVTIVPAGTDTIEGAASVVLSTQYQSATLYSGATGVWYKF